MVKCRDYNYYKEEYWECAIWEDTRAPEESCKKGRLKWKNQKNVHAVDMKQKLLKVLVYLMFLLK